MHRVKKSIWGRAIGTMSITAIALSTLVFAPSSVASPTAQALDFLSADLIDNLQVGDPAVVYENIMSDTNVRARVEVTAIQNMCSELTSPDWDLDWTTFQSDTTDTGVGYRVKYEFDEGPAIYLPPLGEQAFSATVSTASLTGLTQTTERGLYEFQINQYANVNANNTTVVSSTVLRNSSSTTVDTAFHDDYICDGGASSSLHRLDKDGNDPSEDTDRLIEVSTKKVLPAEVATVTLKVSFRRVDNNQPFEFSFLSLNLYDLDSTQFAIFDNILNYQLTADTNVATVTKSGSSWRFDSKPISTSGSDQFTKGRVQVNYQEVSEVIVVLGLPVGENSAGFDLDFSDGATITSEAWTPTSGPAPTTNELGTSSGGSGGVITPAVSLVSPLAPASVPGSRNVSLFGTNFDKVTEVYVGGKKLKIRKQSATQIDIRLPKGLSGLVDLELKSTLNNVLSPKHFNYGGVAGTATRKAELIVGGFAHNSRVLTARMQARIDRWLDKNSDLSTLTCTGFTSLPRRTTDVALSTNRGITACNFSKRQRSELETSVSQGVEDPRPGSNVRRVRLVLTP